MTNHHKFKTGFAAFILCAVMSACTGAAATQPAPLPNTVTLHTPETFPTEIRTPTVISATVTPSSTLTPTVQITRQPTSTPRPSQTAALSRPTKTEDPQSIVTEQFNLKATQVAGFLDNCKKFFVEETSLSPGGNWLAIPCRDVQDPTLEIKNKTGKQWVLHFKDYLPEKFAKMGMQRGDLYPVHWTSDEAYLYFTSYITVDGAGGTCFYGVGEQGLYRINANTGEVSAVLPPIPYLDGYHLAFSPDWGKLAYIADYPTILDLRTGENTAIDDAYAGNLTWSPDDSQLAFATCTPSGNYNKNSALKIYSLKTHQSITVLALEKSFINIEKWDGNQQLKITIYDDQTQRTKTSFFNWSTGQLITPTP